jgi:hypothetical protein
MEYDENDIDQSLLGVGKFEELKTFLLAAAPGGGGGGGGGGERVEGGGEGGCHALGDVAFQGGLSVGTQQFADWQVRVTAALLLLYCCFTAALLLLYCCFTAALLLRFRRACQ